MISKVCNIRPKIKINNKRLTYYLIIFNDFTQFKFWIILTVIKCETLPNRNLM